MASTAPQEFDIAIRAQQIYDSSIRPQVEAAHHGEFVAIDVDSGDYEIDKFLHAATQRLKERKPAGHFFGMRIGFIAAYSFGGLQRQA